MTYSNILWYRLIGETESFEISIHQNMKRQRNITKKCFNIFTTVPDHSISREIATLYRQVEKIIFWNHQRTCHQFDRRSDRNKSSWITITLTPDIIILFLFFTIKNKKSPRHISRYYLSERGRKKWNMHRKIVCHVMFSMSNSCQKMREKKHRRQRSVSYRKFPEADQTDPWRRVCMQISCTFSLPRVVAIFLIENDLDLYMGDFPFGPSHTQSFIRFSYIFFPRRSTAKSPARETHVNKSKNAFGSPFCLHK